MPSAWISGCSGDGRSALFSFSAFFWIAGRRIGSSSGSTCTSAVPVADACSIGCSRSILVGSWWLLR
jgi:hypothetical protein